MSATLLFRRRTQGTPLIFDGLRPLTRTHKPNRERFSGRTAALSIVLLFGLLCTPLAVWASDPAVTDCQSRMHTRAIEDVQQRILDRWDDEPLFEDDRSEWMRVHRDEWEWLLNQRLATYCPTDTATTGRLAGPVSLALFVRGEGLVGQSVGSATASVTSARSVQHGVVCGVTLRWEVAP
jgi:hypothetical protein